MIIRSEPYIYFTNKPEIDNRSMLVKFLNEPTKYHNKKFNSEQYYISFQEIDTKNVRNVSLCKSLATKFCALLKTHFISLGQPCRFKIFKEDAVWVFDVMPANDEAIAESEIAHIEL